MQQLCDVASKLKSAEALQRALPLAVFLFAGCSLFPPAEKPLANSQSPRTTSEKAVSVPALSRATPVPAADYAALRAALTPYGRWVEVPVYGEVWKPAPELVGADWVPFTHGRWVYTKWGWLWVSAFENWGWAAFHFGRFAKTPTEGWVWVPSVDWSPAPVAWRESENYVGWGALPPGYSVSEDVEAGSPVHIPRHVWVFIDKVHFTAPDVAPHVLIERHREALLRVTRLIRGWKRVGGLAVYTGPRPGSLSEMTGKRTGTQIPFMRFTRAAEIFGTKVAPPGYPKRHAGSPQIAGEKTYSEVRPDVDRVVTVVGPNSPKKLPPRKVTRIYLPSETPKQTPSSSSASKSAPKRPTSKAPTPRK